LAIGDAAADKDNQGRVQVPGKSTTLPGLCASVHSDLARGSLAPQCCEDRCVLTPLNADVTDLNNSLLDKLPGETRKHLSDDQHLPDVRQRDKVCGTEHLNKLAPSRLPEHRLVSRLEPRCSCSGTQTCQGGSAMAAGTSSGTCGTMRSNSRT
jgi:hypothetical protein